MGIQFKDVGYTYRGLKTNYVALENINLNIPPKGEMIAICGHTGSGKSTLVQHMNALLLPTTGKVSIFGHMLPPNKREKINHLRQRVGLVFQFPEYQLFEETIIKDIMFGPKNFKHTDVDALEKAKHAAINRWYS
jgi:energy-coupling factor transport system ATP-binding protein